MTDAISMTVLADPPGFFKKINDNWSWDISLNGEFDSTSILKVTEALKRAGGDGADVYINSPGGSLFAGMQVGRLLRKAGANTYIGTSVPDPTNAAAGHVPRKHVAGYCHSACALAFIGGNYRYAIKGDKYGVHRFSSTAGPQHDDLDTAQVISAAVGAYIREMGVDAGLFDYMVQRGGNDIRILSSVELGRLNVVNNGRHKPEWSIETAEGGMYLRGVQSTVYGQGKATFLCIDHEVFLYSSYEVGAEKANSIAAGHWYHSLMTDGNLSPLPQPLNAKASGNEISGIFALTREQVAAVAETSSVGHSMQLARDAPTFVGYRVDVPQGASTKVRTFFKNCVA